MTPESETLDVLIDELHATEDLARELAETLAYRSQRVKDVLTKAFKKGLLKELPS